jgi:dTDP-4-amino-4,6-dideoxygalactose transaminase
MKKPLFYSLPPAGNKIPIKAIAKAIKDGGRFSAGSFEPIKNLLPAKYLLYLSSGRAALWLLLKALSRIRPDKQEVIIPAYTCPAVASAILKAGLKIVLCDINLDDFGFSKNELERKIGKSTLAVILVHLFGYPANIGQVKEWCRKHGIYLIEDAAQAFGNSLPDSPESKLGLLADAGFFSFGRGKPVTVLHGGILATNSEEIFREAGKFYGNLNHSRFQNLRYGMLLSSYSVFSNPYLYWIPQSMPFLHLGETIFEPDLLVSGGASLAASLMIGICDGIENEKTVRQENAQWYYENLESIPGIQGPKNPDFPYLRYPLFIENKDLRDRILDQLTSHGTGATLFYPSPLNELPKLKEILRDTNIYPNAKQISDSLITLPVHSGVTDSNRHNILRIIKNSVH